MMGKDVVKAADVLSLDLSSVTAQNVARQLSDKRLRDEAMNRAEVSKAFRPENLTSLIMNSTEKNKDYFFVEVKNIDGHRNYHGPISPKLLAELKDALRSSSVLTDVRLYNKNGFLEYGLSTCLGSLAGFMAAYPLLGLGG